MSDDKLTADEFNKLFVRTNCREGLEKLCPRCTCSCTCDPAEDEDCICICECKAQTGADFIAARLREVKL